MANKKAKNQTSQLKSDSTLVYKSTLGACGHIMNKSRTNHMSPWRETKITQSNSKLNSLDATRFILFAYIKQVNTPDIFFFHLR